MPSVHHSCISNFEKAGLSHEQAVVSDAARSQEDAEAGRGYAERPRAPGKRPTVKWSKLGSDAESPPGKRTKVQVPGVKAANGK